MSFHDEPPRVLIAERDRRLVTGVRRALHGAGYRTVGVFTPDRLRALLATQPDVLLCDSELLPGQENAIRRNLPRATTIIVTGRESDATMQAAERVNAVLALLKPYCLDVLLATIDDHTSAADRP